MKQLKECVIKENHTIVIGNDHVSDNIIKLINTVTGEVCFVTNNDDFINNIPLSFIEIVEDDSNGNQ